MRNVYLLFLYIALSLLISCTEKTDVPKQMQLMEDDHNIFHKQHKELIEYEPPFNIEAFYDHTPKEWGEQVTGVKTRFITDKKEMALTFDACGGVGSDGYDAELIEFLRQEEIPATLFISDLWIKANKDLFLELSDDPLFQIENHGTRHKPLSVNGGEAWGIEATNSPDEVFSEIMTNHNTVNELTGREMTLFRSGTAFYDEIAVEIAEA